MRAATHGDVVVAARALLGLPPSHWNGELVRWLQLADWADRFRKRTGRVHPFWGNGTLMSAVMALRGPAGGEPALSDPAYLEAFATVIEALVLRCPARKRGASLPVSPATPI